MHLDPSGKFTPEHMEYNVVASVYVLTDFNFDRYLLVNLSFGFEYLYLITLPQVLLRKSFEWKHCVCLLNRVGLSAANKASDTFSLHMC